MKKLLSLLGVVLISATGISNIVGNE
ncbi:lipoprotein [Spiroplasma culicicola]